MNMSRVRYVNHIIF